VPFLERAVGWFADQGVRIERVMTDNRSAYRRGAARCAVRWRCAISAPSPIRPAPTARPSASFRPGCVNGPMRALCDFGRAHRRAGRLARTLQSRPTARSAGPAAARRSPAALLAPTRRTGRGDTEVGTKERCRSNQEPVQPSRLAPVGAQRPSAGPSERSRSNRRVPMPEYLTFVETTARPRPLGRLGLRFSRRAPPFLAGRKRVGHGAAGHRMGLPALQKGQADPRYAA
jgi:hypothetical protein